MNKIDIRDLIIRELKQNSVAENSSSNNKIIDEVDFELIAESIVEKMANVKYEARLWYLKGFKDAETTESQPVPIEQTMKDAETHFELVWDYQMRNLNKGD